MCIGSSLFPAFQVPILLVGNKVDLEHQREVPTVEGMVSNYPKPFVPTAWITNFIRYMFLLIVYWNSATLVFLIIWFFWRAIYLFKFLQALSGKQHYIHKSKYSSQKNYSNISLYALSRSKLNFGWYVYDDVWNYQRILPLIWCKLQDLTDKTYSVPRFLLLFCF